MAWLYFLGDDAEHFAADSEAARLAIRHHSLGSRDDRDPEPVHDIRYVARRLVDTKPGAAHALDLFDHRTARVILQADLELRLTGLVANRIVVDVAFVLEHFRDRGLQLRRGHHHRLLLRLL